MVAQTCNDEFMVVMHEMSFYCDLPVGHAGRHQCKCVEFEDHYKADGALKRQVFYRATWSDKKISDPDHLSLVDGRLVKQSDSSNLVEAEDTTPHPIFVKEVIDGEEIWNARARVKLTEEEIAKRLETITNKSEIEHYLKYGVDFYGRI